MSVFHYFPVDLGEVRRGYTQEDDDAPNILFWLLLSEKPTRQLNITLGAVLRTSGTVC